MLRTFSESMIDSNDLCSRQLASPKKKWWKNNKNIPSSLFHLPRWFPPPPSWFLDFLISFPFLFLFGYFPFRFHMHSSTRRHYYSSFLSWRFDGMKKCFPSLSVTFLRVSLSFSRRPLSIWERRKQQRHRYSAHRQSHWRLIQHFKRRRPPFHFLNLLINDIPSKASPV